MSFIFVVWFAACSVFAGIMSPVDVTGWDADIVIATDDQATTGATAAMDGGDAFGGATVYYEQGFNAGAPGTGLESGLLQSATTSDIYFQLQSFYGNNAVYKGGTLTLTKAVAYDQIALIGATGNGTGNLTITFNYTTGSSQVAYVNGGSGISHDWFNGGSIAYTANGRVSTVSGTFDFAGSDNPRLYESIFDVDETRLLQSVVITDNNSGSTDPRPVVMAISGEAVPEPATAGLLAGAGLLIALYRRFFSTV
jgi:hypothetical protein